MLPITFVMFLLFALLVVMEADIRTAAGATVLAGLALWILFGRTDLRYGIELLIGVLRVLWRLTVIVAPVSFPRHRLIFSSS